jgi:hypothetical protein
MKVIKSFPPNYDEICKVFPIAGIKTIVFTYGDTLYRPGRSGAVPGHLDAHERTHTRQQGNDPAGWWKRYLVDKEFRLSQEVEAYRNQYRFFKSKNHNIKEQINFLDMIAYDLSSEMYGNLVTKEEAKKIII